ncbi:hypothetical protein [Caldalkalibacillus mannanilyticus]|uniref:hypothetical protein n=1 Tax=Caldalkalibacillus mannanilyticus TaxID=1418 RepID=UPI000469387A|nr:hypothetical protein [Caldalkalibacillus mannanilyticus]
MKKSIFILIIISFIATLGFASVSASKASKEERISEFRERVAKINEKLANIENPEEYAEGASEADELGREIKEKGLLDGLTTADLITKEELLLNVETAMSANIDGKKMYDTVSMKDKMSVEFLDERAKIYEELLKQIEYAEDKQIPALYTKFERVSEALNQERVRREMKNPKEVYEILKEDIDLNH